MDRFGIPVSVKHVPELDPEFCPILVFDRAFLAGAKKPVSVAVERDRGQVAVCHTFIHGTDEMLEADCYYLDRLVKTLLWMKGGLEGLCGRRRAGGRSSEGDLVPHRRPGL